jgi:hypothetical protein
MHTCLACGYKGFDVAMRLVEVDEQEARIVDVAITTHEDSHGRPTGMDVRQVRERYVNEPRCRDRKACREREAAALAEWEASRQQPAEASEDLAWLG